jgi:hypothetical protein
MRYAVLSRAAPLQPRPSSPCKPRIAGAWFDFQTLSIPYDETRDKVSMQPQARGRTRIANEEAPGRQVSYETKFTMRTEY